MLYLAVYFDILNRLGLDHDCDGQTDRTAFNNSALTKWVSSFMAVNDSDKIITHWQLMNER